MKLLVVSHACVTAINQQFYASVEAASGWQITLVVPSRWKNNYSDRITPERWPDFKGELIELPVWRPGSIPLHTYQSLFTTLLRQQNPDAIYVHNEAYAASTFQVFLANRLSLNRPIGFYSAQNILKNYPLPFQLFEQQVFQGSQFAFPVSTSVQQVLEAKGCRAKLQCLPLSINTDLYAPKPAAKVLAQELRQSAEEVIVGYLGRITEEKGLKTLLYALYQIQSQPWRLVVVGAGPYEQAFDGLAKQLGLSDRIIRVGYIAHEKAPLYLAAFDLLVLPSETRSNWKEQFGRVVIEALSCGTPVVGSDSGEIPHLLHQTGGGLVFPEGHASALGQRLTELITASSQRQLLADQGRKQVFEQFTNEVICQKFIQTLNACCAPL